MAAPPTSQSFSRAHRKLRFNRNLIAVAHDAFMAAASFMLSVYLRLGEDQMHMAESYLPLSISVFTLTCVVVFVAMRLYRGLWRYASTQDMIAITKAVSLSVLLFAIAMFAINRL